MVPAAHAATTDVNQLVVGPTALSEPLLDRFCEVADDYVAQASQQVFVFLWRAWAYPAVLYHLEPVLL